LSLNPINAPLASCSSRNGSASGFGTPKLPNDGPIPRSNTCFGLVPVMMKPPIPTSFPVPTRSRVERLVACVTPPGVAVGVAVGVGVIVPGVRVGVGVGVGPPGQNQYPWTLRTICMSGKPIVARSVGFVRLQAAALI
jgi:hypothetical protein